MTDQPQPSKWQAESPTKKMIGAICLLIGGAALATISIIDLANGFLIPSAWIGAVSGPLVVLAGVVLLWQLVKRIKD